MTTHPLRIVIHSWIKNASTAGVLILGLITALGILSSRSPVLSNHPAPSFGMLSAIASSTQKAEHSIATPTIVQEAAISSDSSDGQWWVNSGAYAFIDRSGDQETISTYMGDLPKTSPWYTRYRISSPIDTDGGMHPQNLFRLVSRKTWDDSEISTYAYIVHTNKSTSYQRNEWSGVLLMSRYVDEDNLYYAGIRVDGTAVIKKKYKGTYYTMAQVPVFTSQTPYDRATHPTLLPQDTPIGIRSITKTLPNGSVQIELYVDKKASGTWTRVATAIDNEQNFGGPAITTPSRVGLRTDFMDVIAADFTVTYP